MLLPDKTVAYQSFLVFILPLSLCLFICLNEPAARAELNPGEMLSAQNWQEAAGQMPESVLGRFASGGYQATLTTLPATLGWGTKFQAATEANAARFSVEADGRLIETATQTYPTFLYGYPFPQITRADPQAALKVMYNFAYTLMQADDAERLSNLHWVSPTALERYVEFEGQALFYGSRFSGPIANPDGVLRKIIISGVQPHDVDGVATLEWNYLDPQKWNTMWTYLSEIRRTRRLPPAKGSQTLFGSDLAQDDLYLFSGKVSYFTWKLIDTREALVPYTLPNPKRLRPSGTGYVLENPKDLLVMGWERSGGRGLAWWPTNAHVVRRPVWVVEAVAKDAKYGYSRQVLWIDRELYLGYYKTTYDQVGELWRTILNSVSVGKTADGVFSLAQPDFTLAVNEQRNQATVELPLKQGQELSFNTGLVDEQFSPTKLLKRGGM